MGFAKASNQGIKAGKGKYILLLNPDTIVPKRTLGSLVSFADKTQDAHIVGTALLTPGGDIQESVYRFPTILGAIKEYWFGMKGKYSPYVPEGQKAVSVDSVFGTAFLIKRKVIKKIGYLDERYFMYFEDIDYCRRAKKAGFKVYYLPSVKVLHHRGASGKDLARWDLQWKRLSPSSKIYHGILFHYMINSVLWVEQRIRRTKIAFLHSLGR